VVDGTTGVSRDDDIFELGAHSLHAIRIVSRVRDRLHLEFRISDIFEGRTIMGITAQILKRNKNGKDLGDAELQVIEKALTGATSSDSNGSTKRTNGETGARLRAGNWIVPIQTGGRLPPLFFLHGAGGSMSAVCDRISELLGPEQSAYLVTPIKADTEDEQTMESVASRYVDEIRRVESSGPIGLLGFCWGGNLAYEIACQMLERGDAAPFLGLIDAYPKSVAEDKIWKPFAFLRLTRNLSLKLLRFPTLSARERRGTIERTKKKLITKLSPSPNSDEVSTKDIAHVVDIGRLGDQQIELWRRHLELVRNYSEKPYEGHLNIFRAYGQAAFSTVSHDLGWGRLARHVKVHVIRCPHHAIIEEPYIEDLGSALRRAILEFVQDGNYLV
jgi:thioesterase domain-containing protein/acyl carrier protein